ncbi:protein MIX23-like [Watersipora subatra]|uniref:protein MIX23-like n=1 Tax=Watersipora subatra TaxID=2589382 RepID=UPI00355C76B6
MSAPVMAEEESSSLCADFMKFQEVLKAQRKNDDIIINLINSTIPSIESLRKKVNLKSECLQIQSDLDVSHRKRENQIKTCIAYQAKHVEQWKLAKENADPSDNMEQVKQYSSAQRKLRVLQNEMGVEEIVQERTKKALHERCREFF